MSESRGVSITIVNYNNERFLASAIDSALGQDYPALWLRYNENRQQCPVRLVEVEGERDE